MIWPALFSIYHSPKKLLPFYDHHHHCCSEKSISLKSRKDFAAAIGKLKIGSLQDNKQLVSSPRLNLANKCCLVSNSDNRDWKN